MTEDDMWDLLHEGYPWDSSPSVRQAWMDAFLHVETIAWIRNGFDSYWGHWKGHQLTAHAYPGQPSTRTKPPVKPCTCQYIRARTTHSHVETFTGTLIPMLDLPGVSWFQVSPNCPHHGRQILILNPALPPEMTIEALWNDPALNVMRDPYDLDDNERTNQ